MNIPSDFPVQPVLPSVARRADNKNIYQCQTCYHYWDDSIATEYTPARAGRCPFEQFHEEKSEIDTTFQNVTLTISAANSKEAYSYLCKVLSDAGIEYTTDTYTTPALGENPTIDLMGE